MKKIAQVISFKRMKSYFMYHWLGTVQLQKKYLYCNEILPVQSMLPFVRGVQSDLGALQYFVLGLSCEFCN